MCLWFPNWPIQRQLAALPLDNRPALVLYGSGSRGQRVSACCRAARKRGVIVGMPLAEAQSLWPAASPLLRFEPEDQTGDREGLRELAHWCGQFSPKVAIGDGAGEASDCLLLDATGCDYCFGGEEGLAGLAVTALQQHGYWASAAIADTIGAAWGVAHYGKPRPGQSAVGARLSIIPPREHAHALRFLPVEALRLHPGAVEVLHQLKIFRVGQLLELPRAELPSRFGAEMLAGIDRALGVIPETLVFEQLVETLSASWDFEDPIADGRILFQTFDYLLDWLLPKIPEHQGVQQMFCSLKLIHHDPVCFPVERLHPTRSKQALLELLQLQIERLQLPAEVSAVTLQASSIQPLEFRQNELFGGAGWTDKMEVAGFLERLTSKLGERVVLRPKLEPDAQPELACRYEPWLTRGRVAPLRGEPLQPPSDGGDLESSKLTRPIFLRKPTAIAVPAVCPCGTPEQFIWNGQSHRVQHCWGPERIETGWWRNEDVRRDYYIVETTVGERFWLFRNLQTQSWFLHGVFA